MKRERASEFVDLSSFDSSVSESLERSEILRKFGFVRVVGGETTIGSDTPLVCRLEGRRLNETPIRSVEVASFWIAQTKVTNSLFELFLPTHVRPPQSLQDDNPVVDVTYSEALRFCQFLNRRTRMSFRLPSEPEWVRAAAPDGWWLPYSPDTTPDLTKAHTFGDGHEHGCAPVLDPRWEENHLGLDQMGHNTGEFTFGHYRIPQGQWGAFDDGMYCIVKGGDWGHCAYSPRVNRRSIFDVADRNPRIGFRLAHDDI